MAEQWLSIVEYARTYSVSDMTVRRRIKTGKLHAVLKEGKYYIPVQVDTGRSVKDMQSTPAPQQPKRDAAPRRPEISVIKGHPSSQSTFVSTAHSSDMPMQSATVSVNPAMPVATLPADTPIPQSLRSSLESTPVALVESRALLAFCDGSLRSAANVERKIEEAYRQRLEALSQQVKSKDLEINGLKQQIEDLQLLIQILEKKRI